MTEHELLKEIYEILNDDTLDACQIILTLKTNFNIFLKNTIDNNYPLC